MGVMNGTFSFLDVPSADELDKWEHKGIRVDLIFASTRARDIKRNKETPN